MFGDLKEGILTVCSFLEFEFWSRVVLTISPTYVICVDGSPIDWAARTPTGSPGSAQLEMKLSFRELFIRRMPRWLC